MIYADNAATTKINAAAKQAMIDSMELFWGNPSSLHTPGQEAAVSLQKSRETIAKCIGAQPSEIYFVSGGSEADTLAIISAAKWGAKKGKKHIISTVIEHHAVLHPLESLEKEGFEVTLIGVGEDGIVSVSDIANAIREDTALVTVMYANNEIGTIQPIAEIGDLCREKGVVFHTDAVQAIGHLPVNIKEIHVDMLSMSAHKFGGPRGIGVLYAKKKTPLHPIISGGAQERGKRAGTENLPAIAGMATALEIACLQMESSNAHVTAMRDKLIEGLAKIPRSILNGDRNKRLSGNVSFCFEGIEGESLLLLLNAKGIAGSSGSACTSGSLDPSHVMLAIGRPHEIAHGSLRLSLSHENTDEEIDVIIKEVGEVVAYLRSISPLWNAYERGEKEHVIH